MSTARKGLIHTRARDTFTARRILSSNRARLNESITSIVRQQLRELAAGDGEWVVAEVYWRNPQPLSIRQQLASHGRGGEALQRDAISRDAVLEFGELRAEYDVQP